MKLGHFVVVLATSCFVLSSALNAQTTQLASADSLGRQGDGQSNEPALSRDGRWIAFNSLSGNWIAGDTFSSYDVFVKDRLTGTLERISEPAGGGQANGASSTPTLSSDGRYVSFGSMASNLVAADTNGSRDIFVRDRQLGTLERVNVSSSGVQANASSSRHAISGTGRYVAFSSSASNLVGGDTNGFEDIFLRDRTLGTTVRVNLSSGGAQANSNSAYCSVSDDGRYVLFQSFATNLVSGDTNAKDDIFIVDRTLGTTSRVSISSLGGQANDNCILPSMSPDGRFVCWASASTTLVSGDTNNAYDVFRRDRNTGTTLRVSLNTSGLQGDANSTRPSISQDGRFVLFESSASNLVGGDFNGQRDVFRRDVLLAQTTLVSTNTSGAAGNSYSYCVPGSLSGDGRFATFSSDSTNFNSGDINSEWDIFVRDTLAIVCAPVGSYCVAKANSQGCLLVS